MQQPAKDDEIKALLMGLMDGELTPEETHQVQKRLIKDQALRDEYESLCSVCGKLQNLSFHEPEDEVLERLWKSPYSYFASRAAWLLVGGGYLALMLVWAYLFFFTSTEGWQVKIPIAAITIGLLILLIQKIRERISTSKIDPYREVER